MSRLGLNLEAPEALNSVQQQVKVVKQSAERVSSLAEVYGAVQQEARIARAIGEFCPQEGACEIPVPKWSDQGDDALVLHFWKKTR